MKSYASCILVTTNGDIVLQLRDDKPSIKDPNTLSLFAGALKKDETPEDAIVREIKEETTLPLTAFKYLFRWSDGHESESYVFYHGDINLNEVDVQEGQGYQLISGPGDLSKYKFAPISKSILEQYFELNRSKYIH